MDPTERACLRVDLGNRVAAVARVGLPRYRASCSLEKGNKAVPATPGAGGHCDCRANDDDRAGASFKEGNGDEKAAFGGSGSRVGFVLVPFRMLFNKLVLAEQRNAPAHLHPTRDGEDAGGGGAKEGDRFAAVVLTCFLFLFFFMFFLTMFFFLAFCVIVLPYLLRRAMIMVR
ncbi:hypothetical protein DIPPA_25676 [Diplonema papillatum]|nr:hypothetical protein DIPPA_25676 [Diplonema papillatum]